MLQPADQPAPTDRLTATIVQIYPRLLGLLFLFTFIQKLRGQESLDTVLRFDGVSEQLIPAVRWTVIAAELLLAAMLLAFEYLRRATLIATILLLTLYTAQLVFLLLSKDAPSCGCLNATMDYEQANRTNLISLIRNLCLIVPACWSYRQISPRKIDKR